MVGRSETGKLSEAVDFQEEVDALHALLATLPDDDWERPTRFKSWTVNDIVQHLHEGSGGNFITGLDGHGAEVEDVSLLVAQRVAGQGDGVLRRVVQPSLHPRGRRALRAPSN